MHLVYKCIKLRKKSKKLQFRSWSAKRKNTIFLSCFSLATVHYYSILITQSLNQFDFKTVAFISLSVQILSTTTEHHQPVKIIIQWRVSLSFVTLLLTAIIYSQSGPYKDIYISAKRSPSSGLLTMCHWAFRCTCLQLFFHCVSTRSIPAFHIWPRHL